MGADHRLVEMNKAVYEFDRDIIRGAVNAVRPSNSYLEVDPHLGPSTHSAPVKSRARECSSILKTTNAHGLVMNINDLVIIIHFGVSSCGE